MDAIKLCLPTQSSVGVGLSSNTATLITASTPTRPAVAKIRRIRPSNRNDATALVQLFNIAGRCRCQSCACPGQRRACAGRVAAAARKYTTSTVDKNSSGRQYKEYSRQNTAHRSAAERASKRPTTCLHQWWIFFFPMLVLESVPNLFRAPLSFVEPECVPPRAP